MVEYSSEQLRIRKKNINRMTQQELEAYVDQCHTDLLYIILDATKNAESPVYKTGLSEHTYMAVAYRLISKTTVAGDDDALQKRGLSRLTIALSTDTNWFTLRVLEFIYDTILGSKRSRKDFLQMIPLLLTHKNASIELKHKILIHSLIPALHKSSHNYVYFIAKNDAQKQIDILLNDLAYQKWLAKSLGIRLKELQGLPQDWILESISL